MKILKIKKILVVLLLFLFVLPQSAHANGAGLPPFLKINGKYSTPNPLQLFGITAQSFLIPQDFTADNYLVNQPITFEIDSSQLLQVVPDQKVLDNTKYDWDFGDGQKTDGLNNSHTYTKIGSYIMTVTINIYYDPTQQPTQFIDSFLINVLPDKNFHDLPQAIIKTNNQQIADPINNVLNIDLSKKITFDASLSKSQSGIAQYFWNFGDGQTSSRKIAFHTFSDALYDKTVVLRVIDKNGFISDAFIGLRDDPSAIPTTQINPRVKRQTTTNQLIKTISFPLIILIFGTLFYLFISRRNRNKNTDKNTNKNKKNASDKTNKKDSQTFKGY